MSARTIAMTAPERAAVAPLLDDAALPAVRFLTGDDAVEVLRAPIEAAGGHLISATPRAVTHRPGSNLVVKYSAEIVWPDRPVTRETIMAATGVGGTVEAAIPVAAVLDGRRVDVGVWRWPFDPVLVGLTAAVTSSSAAELCGIADPTAMTVDVVAFRPTERAVVRVSTPTRRYYIKVVPPASVDRLVHAHAAAIAAGVAVPPVHASFHDLGIVVFDELAGPLLKEHIKAGTGRWPAPAEFDRLARRFAHIELAAAAAPTRVAHAIDHARMLSGVEDAPTDHLERLSSAFVSFVDESPPQTIHGDLHEGQIVVRDGHIHGVLDLDDLGLGSPLEERANLIAFLRFRAVTLPAHRKRIDVYADRLRRAGAARFGTEQLDIATAAVLVGLATGPFRIQQPGWRNTTSLVLDIAAALLPRSRHTRGTSTTHTTPEES